LEEAPPKPAGESSSLRGHARLRSPRAGSYPMSNRGTPRVHTMSKNRITNPSHENNGQGNGVMHEVLPGTGTLPEELLR
jgi:hypothetical protein